MDKITHRMITTKNLSKHPRIKKQKTKWDKETELISEDMKLLTNHLGINY